MNSYMDSEQRLQLLEALDNAKTETIVLEPQSTFNGGIIGLYSGCLVYGYQETIDSIAEATGSLSEAIDWFHYNTLGSLPYISGLAPIIIDTEEIKILFHPFAEDEQLDITFGMPQSLEDLN
jgi:hypothetical protein